MATMLQLQGIDISARRKGWRFAAGLGRLPADVGAWLRRLAQAQPQATAFLYLKDGEHEEAISYAELDGQARALAAWLLTQGRSGDRVLLLHGPGPSLAAAFFGCLYAGMVAVPAYPPRRTRHGDRLASIVEDCGAGLALCDRAGAAALRAAAQGGGTWAGLRSLDHESCQLEAPTADRWHAPKADDIAFLQYTSGSTGRPKGVMVSHANLRHNIRLFSRAFALDGDSVMVSWAPLFHDMGLILGFLGPLAQGALPVLMPPNAFLRQPSLWLRTLSRYRGTHSVAPDFGYRLCVKSIPPEELAGLDLSNWRVAISGAEPIRGETLQDFSDRFAPLGFRSSAFRPAFGLAEATLVVSGRVDGQGWRRMPGCGRVSSGRPYAQRVRIVDPGTLRTCAEGESGEIWIQGPSVAQGYWGKPAATLEAFGGHLEGQPGTYLRTGDLGCLEDGELVVTGRLKDLIILRGENHFPQDFEATAQGCSEDLRSGAAFGVEGPEGEGAVLVQELARHPKESLPELARKVFRALSEAHGVSLSQLLLVPAMSVPRTSSGKIQRRLCKEAYLRGEILPLLCYPERPAAGPSAGSEGLEEWLSTELHRLGGQRPPEGWQAPCAAWGLDSLRIAELATGLKRCWGVEWPLSAAYEQDLGLLFLAQNVSGVGPPEGGLQGRAEDEGAATLAVPPSSGRRWPVHAAAESLWTAQQLAPASTAYHISWTWQFQSAPGAERLEAALQALARRHTALASAFRTDKEGRLWQEELAAGPLLESPWAQPGPLSEALSWAQLRNSQAFDLAAGRLWRCALLPLSSGGALVAFIFHHLAFDQRSFMVFHEQLEALYRDPRSQVDVPALPGPGAGPEGLRVASRRYWKENLKGWDGLPWDGRSPGKAAAIALSGELGPEVLQALKSLAVKHHCTLFNLASALWAEALGAVAGKPEACFATPITLRDLPLSETAIGYWVHPMPLRLSARRSDGLGQRLAEASRRLQEAMSHRGMTLSEAVREAGCPLPGAFLVYQGALDLPQACLGQPASFRPLDNGAPKAPIALEIAGEERWSLKLDYDPQTLGDEQARRLLQGFIHAALDAAGMHDPALEGLSVLRGASLPQPGSQNVAQAFAVQAQRSPKAAALCWRGGQWDYATLDAKARSIAEHLSRLGLKPGDAVGIAAEPGAHWVAAMLACFGVGLTYVPLDPSYPPERLRHMALAADCKAFLSDRSRPAWAPSCPWSGLEEALAHPLGSWPLIPAPEEGQAAYIIFTSGSSGEPKGVKVGHAALLDLCRGLGKAWALKPSDRVQQFVSISFDPSLEEVLPALLCGASVALPLRNGAPGAQELAQWTRELGSSILHLPAAYWHAFVQADGAKALAAAPQLRAVVVGGESPDPACLRRWAEALPQAAFYNAYGPTEACVTALLWSWQSGQTLPETLPLGLPLPGVEAVVCDPAGRALAAGQVGEIWLSGGGLALGYLNAADEEGRFLWASPDGGPTRRFYRSGDLAVLGPDGNLSYRGRADRQVKLLGMRLDLEELEALLRAAPGVAAAAVLSQGKGEGLSLEAFASPLAGASLVPKALEDWLRERVPAAWIPARIAVLPSLPLTPNGKTDYRALQGPTTAVAEASPAVPAALQDDALSGLTRAFALALGRAEVAPDLDFFEAGGNSLRAVRLVAELAGLGLGEVPVTALYAAPTPRALLAFCRQAKGNQAGPLRHLGGEKGLHWVLLPPVSGRLEPYQRLAGLLSVGSRVWGLDLEQMPPPAEDGWQRWAQLCAESIHQALPEGPLALAGWSMGGLLAAELSSRLPALGRKVLRLAVIDALLPDPLTTALVRHDSGVLEELIDRDLDASGFLRGVPGPDAEGQRQRYRLHAQALGGFEAKPLGVPLSLVVSEKTAKDEARNGWMAWALMAARGMTTQLVPGDHFGILNGPALRRISQRLIQDCESEIQREEALQ